MIWSILILYFGLTFAQERVTFEYLTELRAAGRDEEYARLLGIDDPSLVRPSTQARSEFINKPVSPLGDIMLSKEQKEQSRQNINFGRYFLMKWENDTVPFYIQHGDFTKKEIDVIYRGIGELNMRTKHLKIVKACEDHKDSVVIINGQGCWSYIGRQRGMQALSLDVNGCVTEDTVMHEFMHALGFAHMHNTYDRDDYILMKWYNIPEEWRSQFDKVDDEDFEHLHTYDYYSMMHYPETAPRIYNDAFDVLLDGINETAIGHASTVSEMDVIKMDYVYHGCRCN